MFGRRHEAIKPKTCVTSKIRLRQRKPLVSRILPKWLLGMLACYGPAYCTTRCGSLPVLSPEYQPTSCSPAPWT